LKIAIEERTRYLNKNLTENKTPQEELGTAFEKCEKVQRKLTCSICWLGSFGV
jgi:hypothetical protein